jgi:hypothetical protein
MLDGLDDEFWGMLQKVKQVMLKLHQKSQLISTYLVLHFQQLSKQYKPRKTESKLPAKMETSK